MPIRLASRRQQSGLSLIEVLIATVVLSTGLLGLAGLQIAGMKTTHNSYQMQQATWIVYELLERMRANNSEVFREDAAGNAVSSYLQTKPDCGEDAPVCANATSCTGSEIAAIDIYNVMCGERNPLTDKSSGGINNVLIGGALQITCPYPNSAGNSDCRMGVVVDLQWDERNATSQDDFDGGTDGMETFTINLKAML
ncbi:MAG: type IV pilus modification protein PilV [Thiothrix lacustris]|uniref:Type IV pilus modification protein PilV n=1 Tax=Thiothrix lacustris TaxID=525917 RepID=A0A1Y1QNS9_9GAMM|nr:MAG: type IV pilus modification protein PilV [Thiothrix lacustris]